MTTHPFPTATHPTHLELMSRFDVHEVAGFRSVVTGDCPVVLDLSGVRFIDAAGLHSLVEARARLLDRGFEMWVVDPSPAALITFELAGLSEAFPVLADAVAA